MMWRSIGCGIIVMLMLNACSTADVTGDESFRQYGDTVFTNEGSGNQVINIKLYAASAKATEQSNESDPTASVDPNISVGLNGGTSSLAADGGKMLLEGITSMIDAGVNKPAPVVPVDPKPPIVIVPPNSGVEVLDYHGRHNGDRPTWYGDKNLNEYPAMVRVAIQGCCDDTVDISGNRPNGTPGYEGGGLIVKQSDVTGRGMAVIYSASCKSETATIEY